MLVWEDEVKSNSNHAAAPALFNATRDAAVSPLSSALTAPLTAPLTTPLRTAFAPAVVSAAVAKAKGLAVPLAASQVASLASPSTTPVAATRRVNAADKRIINGQTDVNQLVPFKYK